MANEVIISVKMEHATVELRKESGHGGFYALCVNGVHIWRFDEIQADVIRLNLLKAKQAAYATESQQP